MLNKNYMFYPSAHAVVERREVKFFSPRFDSLSKFPSTYKFGKI